MVERSDLAAFYGLAEECCSCINLGNQLRDSQQTMNVAWRAFDEAIAQGNREAARIALDQVLLTQSEFAEFLDNRWCMNGASGLVCDEAGVRLTPVITEENEVLSGISGDISAIFGDPHDELSNPDEID